MTRGAVYVHFSSTADLARALTEQQHARWAAIEQPVDNEPLEGLDAIHYLLGDPVTYAGIIVGMFLGVHEFTEIADRELTSGSSVLDPSRYTLDSMWELILHGLSVAS